MTATLAAKPAAPARPRLTITYVQADGSRQAVYATTGMSLMEAALRAGVPGIDAKCRGHCACVTCHVHIAPAWRAAFPPPAAMEESMLDFAEDVAPGSRLACQVRLTQACDGVVVHVPPAQRTLGL